MQKHAIAEQYRGLYNKEIDSIIDEINIKFNTLLQLEETIPDDLGIKKMTDIDTKKLRQYRYLNKDLNSLFNHLFEVINLLMK